MTRCVQCGFTSDDPAEAAGHLHHPRRCGCGQCLATYGPPTERATLVRPLPLLIDELPAYEVWLEGAA